MDVTVSASDDDGITQIGGPQRLPVIKTCQSGAPCTIITARGKKREHWSLATRHGRSWSKRHK